MPATSAKEEKRRKALEKKLCTDQEREVAKIASKKNQNHSKGNAMREPGVTAPEQDPNDGCGVIAPNGKQGEADEEGEERADKSAEGGDACCEAGGVIAIFESVCVL